MNELALLALADVDRNSSAYRAGNIVGYIFIGVIVALVLRYIIRKGRGE